MGAYGSPELYPYKTEDIKKTKKVKKSNAFLIIIDAILLSFLVYLIEVFTLLKYPTALAISNLLTFGLSVGLTVGFFKKIRNNFSNRLLLLIMAATLFGHALVTFIFC